MDSPGVIHRAGTRLFFLVDHVLKFVGPVDIRDFDTEEILVSNTKEFFTELGIQRVLSICPDVSSEFRKWVYVKSKENKKSSPSNQPTDGRRTSLSSIPGHPMAQSILNDFKMDYLDRGLPGDRMLYTFLPHLSRLLYAASQLDGFKCSQDSKGFTGSTRQLAKMCGKYARATIKNVLDEMENLGAAPGTKRVLCDAFISLMSYISSTDECSLKDRSDIDVMGKQYVKRLKNDFRIVQQHRQAGNNIENRLKNNMWPTTDELKKCLRKAYETVVDTRDRLEMFPGTGKHAVIWGVDAFCTILVLKSRCSRPGALDGMSLQDLVRMKNSPIEERSWETFRHKNGRLKKAVISFKNLEVHECTQIYLDVFRPKLVDPEKTTDLAFINSLGQPLRVGRAASVFMTKTIGKKVSSNTVRAVIATKVEELRHEGIISKLDADSVHLADNHTPSTAIEHYAQGTQHRIVEESNRIIDKNLDFNITPNEESKNEESQSVKRKRNPYSIEERRIIEEHVRKHGRKNWVTLETFARGHPEIFKDTHMSKDSLKDAARRFGL